MKVFVVHLSLLFYLIPVEREPGWEAHFRSTWTVLIPKPGGYSAASPWLWSDTSYISFQSDSLSLWKPNYRELGTGSPPNLL